MLFYTEDRKNFKNERIFSPFISHLNSLSKHSFNISNAKYKKIVLVPCLVVGDNLGINSALGVVECFLANYCCRFCNMHRKDLIKACKLEDDVPLLDYNFYTDCIKNKKFLIDSSVKENSVWINLNNFHVTSNLSVDIMHDLLEGICHYDMFLLLDIFINRYQYFTLEELNSRMLYFSYELSDRNKPPLLNSDQLTKKNLK